MHVRLPFVSIWNICAAIMHVLNMLGLGVRAWGNMILLMLDLQFQLRSAQRVRKNNLMMALQIAERRVGVG
jgi:hypothetical protein